MIICLVVVRGGGGISRTDRLNPPSISILERLSTRVHSDIHTYIHTHILAVACTANLKNTFDKMCLQYEVLTLYAFTVCTKNV